MLKRLLSSAAIAASLMVCAGATAVAAPPPTAEAFGRVPAVASVRIAPDGKHIAAVTSTDGVHTQISVWATDAMDKPPVVINGNNLAEFTYTGVRFIKNDRLTVTFRYLFGTGPSATHNFKTIIMAFDGKTPPRDILPSNDQKASSDVNEFNRASSARIIDVLPLDPRKILVFDTRADTRGDIDKVDVYSGTVERVMKGSDKYQYGIDLKGEVRTRDWFDFDNGKLFAATDFRDPATGQWSELFRWYAKDREQMSLEGFTENPNIVLVSTPNHQDKTAIYEYDVKQHKIGEQAFGLPLFNAAGVVESRDPANYGEIIGFRYDADRGRTYWTNGEIAAMEKQVRDLLHVKHSAVDWVDPGTGATGKVFTTDGFDVDYVGGSRDGSQVLFVKSGPKSPPEYYLLSNKTKLQLLAKARPQIDPTTLGDTRMVEFAARDGLMIPAFLTTPPQAVYGPGPYPTIVTPHGGPWARDELDWDFSGWTQYFAARGYAVIQPQFRGSEGWGQKLWRAGDKEWGQKMQDDDDDAAKWLISQHIADPNRIALHGYSYGGYTAFTAAVRPNGIYKCAIAGAGVAELASFKNITFTSRFTREFQNPTIEGLDPLSHAAQVSIPMLIYHGTRDQTVDISESRRFAAALKAAGKPYKLVEIPDMGHQGNLWKPGDLKLVLETIEQFLKTDCKPGGL